MELTTAEKIRIIMKRRKMTLTQLAALTGMTRQNLCNKLTRNDFPESELIAIGNALECTFIPVFQLDDTKEKI